MQRSACIATILLFAHASFAGLSPDAAFANPIIPTIIDQPETEAPVESEPAGAGDAVVLGPLLPAFVAAEPQAPAVTPDVEPEAQGNKATEHPPLASPAEAAETVETVETPSSSQAESAVVRSNDSLPLGSPSAPPFALEGDTREVAAPLQESWLVRTIVGLVAVIGLIVAVRFGLQWLEARTGGGSSAFASSARAPSGLVEVLARYTVSRGSKLLLLKIDSRILVVSQANGEMQTLSEITNPEEVASILLKTRDEEGETIANQFTKILRGLENDASVLDDPIAPLSPRRALVAAQERAIEEEPADPVDGVSALRNRLSRFGDLSA